MVLGPSFKAQTMLASTQQMHSKNGPTTIMNNGSGSTRQRQQAGGSRIGGDSPYRDDPVRGSNLKRLQSTHSHGWTFSRSLERMASPRIISGYARMTSHSHWPLSYTLFFPLFNAPSFVCPHGPHTGDSFLQFSFCLFGTTVAPTSSRILDRRWLRPCEYLWRW